MAEGVGGLVEGKDAVDGRMDAALGDGEVHILEHAGAADADAVKAAGS